MSIRTLSNLDRTVFQPLGRIIQEAFSDGMVANFAITTGRAVQWACTCTATSGNTRTFNVDFTSATDKSSGENVAFGAAVSVTGNCSGAYPIKTYTGNCGDAVIGSLCSYYTYMDDIGAAATVSEKHALDLNISNTNAPTLSSFMRMYNHGGTIDAAFYFANNGNGVVDYLFKWNASGNCLIPDASALPGNATHKIKCKVGGSDFYLIGVADF